MADLGAIGASGSVCTATGASPTPQAGMLLGNLYTSLSGFITTELKLDLTGSIKVWPAELPDCPKPDYNEDFGLNVLRSPMDAGPAKARYRALRPDILKVSYDLTTAEVEILKDFIKNTLRGVYRFRYVHPRTRTNVEARIVPAEGGKMFDLSYFSHDVWTVTLTLEVLP